MLDLKQAKDEAKVTHGYMTKYIIKLYNKTLNKIYEDHEQEILI